MAPELYSIAHRHGLGRRARYRGGRSVSCGRVFVVAPVRSGRLISAGFSPRSHGETPFLFFSVPPCLRGRFARFSLAPATGAPPTPLPPPPQFPPTNKTGPPAHTPSTALRGCHSTP